ncbi:hypothetical protein ACFLWA_00305 [Chloroflexota bacterium]
MTEPAMGGNGLTQHQRLSDAVVILLGRSLGIETQECYTVRGARSRLLVARGGVGKMCRRKQK